MTATARRALWGRGLPWPRSKDEPAAAACVLGRADVRALDGATIAAGTPALELMERAGAAIAHELARAAAGLAGGTPGLLVLAGSGNNGGDGFVVARLLAERHWACTVALCAGEPRAGGEAAINLERWRRCGGAVIDLARAREAIASGAPQYGFVLDALLGTGLDRPVDAKLVDLIHCLNSCGNSHAGSTKTRLAVVAVDIPSGLCADSGRPLGCAVRASATVALGAYKPGLFLADGPDYAGRLLVADIGLLAPARAGLQPLGLALDASCTAGALAAPAPMTHKGTRGHVLIVAGSRGKSGAGVLCARGALRSGAGLVTLALPRSQQPIAAACLAELMTAPLPEDDSGALAGDCVDELEALLEMADSVVFGPGLGTGEGAEAALRTVLSLAGCPVVLDADGLNILSRMGEERRRLLEERASRSMPPVVLTPHPGEMARLVASTTDAVQASRLEQAVKLAKNEGCCVVLKGAGTIISDGARTAFNASGNAGMATAGMGDVLGGVIGALAARGLDLLDAAALGVYAHGIAGDSRACSIGATAANPQAPWSARLGFLASEVADALPAALAGICA